MRIYFAGSIRGGRDDADIYMELVRVLQRHGEVLTEHVATVGEEQLPDVDIYARDLDWLISCDAVVAEVTTPSLGVGYEIAVAIERGIPVLCLFRPEAEGRLSAMLTGNPSANVVEYRNLDAVSATVAGFLNGLSD
jgi:nucleoside 2-deoxyribosyltransferase